MIIAFICLIFCILTSVGVFHYTYAMAADRNRQGMRLLVTIPAEVDKDGDVQQIIQMYRRDLKSLTLKLLLVGGLLSAGFLWPRPSDYVILFMLLAYASFLAPMALYASLLQRCRQKLLRLKAERGWSCPAATEPVVYADLMTSRLKNKKTPSNILFALPALGSAAIFWAFPQARQGNMLLVLLGVNLLIHGLCFGIHYFIAHAPAKVYTADSRVNLALNQEYRRWWSVAYLLLSFLQTVQMFLLVIFHFRFIEEPSRLGTDFLVICMVMALVPVLVILMAHRRIQAQEKELLSQVSLPAADEDNYYEFCGIYGFYYSNPHNPALMVEKPFGIGSTLNIGLAKGRRIFTLTKILFTALLAGIFLIVVFEDFIPPVMQVSVGKVSVARTLYPVELTAQQIENIRLIEDKFAGNRLYKNVGSATSRYLRGNFLQKGSPVRLYLFPNSSPYLRFQLKNADCGQLYFNYQNPEQTQALWQRLKANLPAALFADGQMVENATDLTDNGKNNNPEAAPNAVGEQTTENPASEAENSTEPNDNQPKAENTSANAERAAELAAKRQAVTEAELDYSIPAGQGSLHAVLNLPEGAAAPVPALLFIGGSGPATKEGIANIYLDTAMHLLEHGIACVRYDKRGIARSASVVNAAQDEDKMVIEDFVGDAAALLQKMKADQRFSKVYVLGHSEGALVGTLALQKTAADGLICLAGAGRNIAEVTLEQITANPNNPSELVENSRRIIAELKAGRTVSEVPLLLNSLFRPSVQPYLISWMRYEPAEEIAKLKETPILIVQGGNDMQVQVIDAENLHRAVPKSRLAVLPEMTHMLKNSAVSKDEVYRSMVLSRKYLAVYQDDSLPIAPQLIEEITGFIGE